VTPGTDAAPERILCDTTYISVRLAAVARPEFVAHWPADVTDRLEQAVLMVSVVSLAELRGGQIGANFPPEKVERHRRVIDAYVPAPLDPDVSEVWAHLWAWRKSNPSGINDNDLWIAATAISRKWPLVSCDRHFIDVPDLDHIYLQRTPDSRN
jgi:predicted nucleic acid-binding protein